MATEKYRYERAPATIQRIARALKLSSFKKEYGGVKSRNTRIPTKTDNPFGRRLTSDPPATLFVYEKSPY